MHAYKVAAMGFILILWQEIWQVFGIWLDMYLDVPLRKDKLCHISHAARLWMTSIGICFVFWVRGQDDLPNPSHHDGCRGTPQGEPPCACCALCLWYRESHRQAYWYFFSLLKSVSGLTGHLLADSACLCDIRTSAFVTQSSAALTAVLTRHIESCVQTPLVLWSTCLAWQAVIFIFWVRNVLYKWTEVFFSPFMVVLTTGWPSGNWEWKCESSLFTDDNLQTALVRASGPHVFFITCTGSARLEWSKHHLCSWPPGPASLREFYKCSVHIFI